MYIAAICLEGGRGVVRKGQAAPTRRKKNTLKYTGNPGEWIHGLQTRPFDNVALYIANNRRRPCAPEALFSASSMYGHLGYTSECYTFRSACRCYAHTCLHFVNISWRWNKFPVDDNILRSWSEICLNTLDSMRLVWLLTWSCITSVIKKKNMSI